jgi:hypothetical protein
MNTVDGCCRCTVADTSADDEDVIDICVSYLVCAATCAIISASLFAFFGGCCSFPLALDYELREKNNKIHHPKSSPQIHQIQLYLLVRDYKVSMVVNITYHNTLTPIDLCQFNTQIGAGSSSSSSK